MIPPPAISLRQRLRHDTRVAHENLDREVSTFDLVTLHGLRGYLAMHATALAALAEIETSAVSSVVIDDLLHRTVDDLRRLGCADSLRPARLDRAIDPVAIDYVVLGSRLGSAVLRKRWQAGTDPRIAAINGHFTAPSYLTAWQQFCQETDSKTGHGPEADRIIRDANSLFAFYLDECMPVLSESGVK